MAAIVESRTEHVTSETVAAWCRLWAIAMVAHIVGNPTGSDWTIVGPVNAIAGLIAIAVILDPTDRRLRTALAVAIPLSAIAEAPLLGNHWFVAALISLAALIAKPWQADLDWWRRFAPTARVILLVFYSFAAFAKLNSGFFDPVASCARYFANRTLGFWQLPEIGGSSWIASVLPFLTVAVELSVPLLLVYKPTRRYGVWLGIAFHLLLTLDLRQHFFDFTLVLIPLFLLFSPASALTRLDEKWPRLRLGGGKPWIALAALVVLGATLPGPVIVKGPVILFTWGLWLWLGVIIARATLAPRRTLDQPSQNVALKPPTLVAVGLLAIVIANGLSPYFEVKSATGFNMYANLSTVGGETNHFIVPGTLQLRNEQTELAHIIATDDEELAEYIPSGFGLPLANLRDYLAAHPDIAVTFEVEGGLITLDRAGDHPEWLDAQPALVEKFFFFRAVPDDDPPSCQPTWLAAR